MLKKFLLKTNRSIPDNGLLLQAVACRNAKLSEFARTIQAKNNNNQSQMKLLIVVAVIFSAFLFTIINYKKHIK